MDWFAPIDLYCERTVPGLTGEPFNAVSNLAFFLAAALSTRSASRHARGFLYAMRRLVALSWLWSVIVTAIFLVASLLFAAAVPPAMLNGSVSYLPAFAGLAGLGAFLFSRHLPAGHWLIAAAGVFLVSLTFRTIDLAACTCLPAGTHWVWHTLNALVLYLALAVAIRFGAPNGLAERPRHA